MATAGVISLPIFNATPPVRHLDCVLQLTSVCNLEFAVLAYNTSELWQLELKMQSAYPGRDGEVHAEAAGPRVRDGRRYRRTAPAQLIAWDELKRLVQA